MKLVTAIKLLHKSLLGKGYERDYARFYIAEQLSGWIYPKYLFSDYGRIWQENEDFLKLYQSISKGNNHHADRKFLLGSLLESVRDLPGDTVECGVLDGASSLFMCKAITGLNKEHHIFDSFEGLSQPLAMDGDYWQKGGLKPDMEVLQHRLGEFDFVKYHKGWIPEKFTNVADRNFCFVHIDVDLYVPTLDSLKFFYDKMTKGGIILSDDYGSEMCPGAKRAFDEFFDDKPERIVHVPTGQGFVIKK